MFENLVAGLLNKHLGKYIQNLDTENLSVGITDGSLELTDLQLKPEALFELDLPIEVKAGYVGKISVAIPWTSLYSMPVIVTVEDVYVLACPVSDRKYDAKREKALHNAIKRKKLADLEYSPDGEGEAVESGFMAKLTATILNNIQVSIQRIHIRYEDRVMDPDHPFACGIVLKQLGAETTNNQWQPMQIDGHATQINKLVHLHALSVYWNPYLPEQNMVRNKLHTTAWRNLLKNSIDTYRIMEEDFDFILRPVTARAKLVLNKEDSTSAPRLLADFIMEEIDVLVSRQQFLNMLSVADSFKMMAINQHYRRYSPGVSFKGNIAAWWHYAYKAVVEEYIRPFSWERIRQHRVKYRRYKDVYKKQLELVGNENLANQLQALEEELDVANIVMAREQAKLEFAQEAPERAKKKKAEQGWWDRLWSSSPDDGADEEIIITPPDSNSNWLNKLGDTDRQRLYKAIGYNANENIEHAPNYVAHRLNFSLLNASLSLVNYSKEVLKVTITNLTTSIENRPDTNGFKFSAKNESFVLEGVSIEHDLVPLVTSDIGVYAPSVTQVFSFDLEVNPVHVEADLAVRLNVQPVEIVYDEHAVTEVIAFFQVPQVTMEDVRAVAQASWDHMSRISRISLQYAIEQHKTMHLSVNMRSPYVVIPEYGTLHRGGNLVVIDLGKLKVESELQPKNISLHECTMSEIESRLYDKFNITITEVKVLLADSGEDWHTAQTQPDSEFHVLPSVGMQLAFFNSVKSDYAQLPHQKLEAKITTLKLHLSDEKIQMMSDFFKHIPMPHSNSMMGLDDSMDHVDGGHIEPVLYAMMHQSRSLALMMALHASQVSLSQDEKTCQVEPSMDDLKLIRHAVRVNSVVRGKRGLKKGPSERTSGISIDSTDNYYSASDHSDEDVDDWARAFNVPAVDDHTSSTNTINLLLRFVLGEVVIQVSKSADKIDTPYLMFRVDRLCVDTALTVYGLAMQASLGGIQLVDKIHTGSSGEYLEILSSKSDKDLITVVYRRVSPSCPDFEMAYRSTEQGLIVRFSSLRVIFDRAAVLYLNAFVQGLLIGVNARLDAELKKSTSTILLGPTHPHPDNESFTSAMFVQPHSGEGHVSAAVTKFHLVAKMDDLDLKLCNHEMEFCDVMVRDLETKIVMKPTRTVIQAKLTDLSIEDLTENTLYPRVLTIEDDQLFVLKYVSHTKLPAKYGMNISRTPAVDSSLRLRLGRIQGVLLYKFLTEASNFIGPLINPDVYDAYRVAAQTAVHNKLADVQEQGTRVSMNLDIRAPSILVPQHSESTNVLVFKLGDISLKNCFEDTEVGGGVSQHWDHMYLRLDSVQLMRGKLSLNGNIEHVHTMIDPLSLRLDLKRALPPLRTDLAYDIGGKLNMVKMQVTQQDLKVMMAVMRENRFEVGHLPDKIDLEDLNPVMPDRIGGVGQDGLDITTPVVEIEEPLLDAPEVADLARQTHFDIVLDGMVLTLLGEEEDPLAPISPVRDEFDALSRFEMGKMDITGMLNSDSSLEVKIKLQSIALDDVRENSNLAIKRIIVSNLCPTGKGPGYIEPMVVFEYKISKEGNQHINLNAETVRVNVCMPYLLMVYGFFTVAMEIRQSPPNIRSQPEISKPQVGPPPTSSTAGEGPQTPMLTGTTFTVSGRFKQPEIVLFAEPTQQHSRVLVLKTNCSFDYFQHGDRERLEAKVKQLQIISCVYGLRNQTASMVLFPCDLEFTRSSPSPEGSTTMDAKLSDVYLHMSATTIHIFLDVLEMIQQDGRRLKGRDDSISSTLHHELWRTTAISAEEWLEEDPETANQDLNLLSLMPQTVPVESLHVDMKRVQIMFEVENLDYHVPRLCFKTAMQANLHDWSKQLRMDGEVKLEMSYFNDQLASWEPLLEPVMEVENNYRPWEVNVKLVQADSHPIACASSDLEFDRQDMLDGEVHYLMSRTKVKSDSSDTETDSETEMTVIKPKVTRKMRLGSDRSYDSASHHSSVQGESDSEPEGLINTLSSNLDSIFSSDSSEGDLSEGEDEIFESSDKPVFLTAKGPVHVDAAADAGLDEVDGVEPEAKTSLCTYLLIDSRDQLQVNLTPQAMDVITEVTETLMRSSSSTLKSVHDLPGFEMYNQLEIQGKLTVSPELKIYEENLHNLGLTSKPVRSPQEPVEGTLVEIDDLDDVDGLHFLSRNLATAGDLLTHAVAFVFEEEDQTNEHSKRKELTRDRMHVKLDNFDELCNLSHRKAVTKLVQLSPCRNDTNYCVVYDVDVLHGRKVVSLRSPLQLHNHLTVPLEVYCKTEDLHRYSGNNIGGVSSDGYTQLKVVDAGMTYDIPLFVAYHCRLHVAPAGIGYEKTACGLWWQDLSVAKDKSKFFSCLPQEADELNPFHFKVCCEEGPAMKTVPMVPKHVPHYVLHLHPTVVIHNLLPYDIQFSLESSAASSLTHGELTPLYTADLSQAPKLTLQVSDYLGLDWAGSLELSSSLEEFKAITMETELNVEGQNKQLSLNVHVNRVNSMHLYVYSPYWIINRTALPIHIRGSRSEVVYENDISTDPLLFRFKKHRRKKAKLRLYNSKWTRSFSMDTVGSSGVVIVNDKERNRKYQFMLQVQMSRLKLTKIVTILPYFLVANNTPNHLRYMEENEQADLWLNITPGEVCPFWPSTDSMMMYIKYQDSKVSSQHFCIKRPHITVLRMDRGTALVVEVSGGTESPITVSFMPYEHGDAPVRVDNLCEDVFVKLHQKNQSQVSLLSPNQSVLYTWDDPTSERTLMWNVYNRKKPSYPAFISKDGFGEVPLSIQTVRRSSVFVPGDNKKSDKEKKTEHREDSSDDDTDEEHHQPQSSPIVRAPLLRSSNNNKLEKQLSTRTDKVVVYWVSYLDGLQRVILFTQDERISKKARKVNEAEQSQYEVFLSLGGIGVSLVNSLQEEVAYATLSSAPAMWDVEVKNKWKLLNMELASWLEEKWRNGDSKVYLEDFMEADLEKMEMKKPFMGALRRNYHPALWCHYRQSAHHTYLHAKVHRLQIDNQLNDAYFPTVLHPSPIPAYIVKKAGPKPFIEFALMRRQIPENHIDSVKFFKLLMQEFNLKIDKGFLMSVYDIFASRQKPEKESTQLAADLNLTHRSLRELADIHAASRPQRIIFEYLHLSPLKMHVSFSLDGRVHSVSKSMTSSSVSSDLVDFFLTSVGATLTEIKEVEIRMAYFERRGAMMTTSQLLAEVQHHYMSQAIKQSYVLLLGLDVLGNPYGLVKDFTQGLGDFFYEPFLGTIQGPDKFTENLVRGVRSLMGHTVGGVAGSLSQITGSLGKTLATLSFDKDYKQKRQQMMSQRPRHLPESLYLAGKGFIVGVALGLSGVVVNPVRGAYEEGVEGFFKGVGKGLLGLITKPTGGVVDMVSMAFDGIRRAAEMGDDVIVRMRLPRYINPDKGLKPYSPYQSIGMRMLNYLSKGRYVDTDQPDIYWAHASLSKEDKTDVTLVTTRHIFLLEKSRFWGEWDIEWEVPLSDVIAVPGITENKLIFKVRRDDTGFSIFTSDEREIVCDDHEVLVWLQKKIEQAITNAKYH